MNPMSQGRVTSLAWILQMSKTNPIHYFSKKRKAEKKRPFNAVFIIMRYFSFIFFVASKCYLINYSLILYLAAIHIISYPLNNIYTLIPFTSYQFLCDTKLINVQNLACVCFFYRRQSLNVDWGAPRFEWLLYFLIASLTYLINVFNECGSPSNVSMLLRELCSSIFFRLMLLCCQWKRITQSFSIICIFFCAQFFEYAAAN